MRKTHVFDCESKSLIDERQGKSNLIAHLFQLIGWVVLFVGWLMSLI